MEKQTAIRITDDKSWLQSLLNTIYEQRDRALKAEAELRKCYKDIQALTAERTDARSMLADAEIRNGVLERRLNKLMRMYVEMAVGQCDEECYALDDDVKVSLWQCKACWRERAVKQLEEVQP